MCQSVVNESETLPNDPHPVNPYFSPIALFVHSRVRLISLPGAECFAVSVCIGPD
jgi:hypothetical protein